MFRSSKPVGVIHEKTSNTQICFCWKVSTHPYAIPRLKVSELFREHRMNLDNEDGYIEHDIPLPKRIKLQMYILREQYVNLFDLYSLSTLLER